MDELKPYPAYRDSGVAYLGQSPEMIRAVIEMPERETDGLLDEILVEVDSA